MYIVSLHLDRELRIQDPQFGTWCRSWGAASRGSSPEGIAQAVRSAPWTYNSRALCELPWRDLSKTPHEFVATRAVVMIPLKRLVREPREALRVVPVNHP
jgi:hypothetical protein